MQKEGMRFIFNSKIKKIEKRGMEKILYLKAVGRIEEDEILIDRTRSCYSRTRTGKSQCYG